MSNKYYSQKVLELSLNVKEKLKINHDISLISDVNIDFFEEIFKRLSPSYESFDKTLSERFETIINWLSSFLNISFDHIDVQSLVSYDPLSLFNLLEILCLCVDENEDTSDCASGKVEVDGLNDEEIMLSSTCTSNSKEKIDTNLEESRLKYLQCKLVEMFSTADYNETPLRQMELTSHLPARRLSHHVKFAAEPNIIPSSLLAQSHCSTGSLLRQINRPLPQSSNGNIFPLSTSFTNTRLRFRHSHSVPYAKFNHSESGAIFEELMRQLDVLDLSRETQNYIKIRLESCLKAGGSAYSSRSAVERRLAEMAERQEKRIELTERIEEDASRMRALRDSRAFDNFVRAEMHRQKRQSVFDKYFDIRQEERLQAHVMARKIEEDRVVRKAFDVALGKLRQHKLEVNKLMREVREKELELQNTLISNVENRYEERARFLKDEGNKRQEEAELKAKSNKMENLREKMELRLQLTKQIKELEDALLNQIKS